MDISTYISELLYNHDCVIIPGFGGFICNYKPAEIHPVFHTIAPPSKAISFNKNLQTNDGLLVNYISNSLGISFDKAVDGVNTWVSSSASLLKSKEELQLKKIGKFFNDIEGNLQFVPDNSVNYLKSSFGLKTITAEPVLRGKEIDLTERSKPETKSRYNVWKIAAVIMLLVTISTLAQLMWMGVEIKSLNLNEASVLSFVSHIFKSEEHEIKPIPVVVETRANVDSNLTAVTNISNVTATVVPGVKEENIIPLKKEPRYYVIIGAFADERNVTAAKGNLLQKFPESAILTEKGAHLTRLGYLVGSDPYKAKEQLKSAQSENSSYWLLKE